MPAPEYVTVADVAARLGVSVLTVRRLVSDGSIRGAVKVGARVRVPVAGVDEYLAGRRIGTPS